MKDKCPTCGKPFHPAQDRQFQPFCSDRCRLIDLGKWLAGENRIPSGEPVSTAPSSDSDEDHAVH